MYDDHVSLYYYHKAWHKYTLAKLQCIQRALTKITPLEKELWDKQNVEEHTKKE